MTGLRERKKQQTRQQILHAAAQLFAEKGLTAPTMEEIAGAAEVSVGTLYNYFGSKTALQLGLLEDETEAMVAAGAAIVERPGDDPTAAVAGLFEAYLEVMLHVDRRLLRDAMRVGLTEPDLTAGLVGLDLRLMGQLGVLLGDFAGRGLLAPAIDVEHAGLALYSVFVVQLIFYVTVDAIEPGHVRSQARGLVETVFAGLTTRERRNPR